MDIKEIVIKSNGKWYFGESEMFRREILKLLASNITKNDDGTYSIVLGEETNPITVEDVPFYATGITEENDKIKLRFHDLQEIILDKEMKLTLKGDVPYIDFKWEADTRLSRGVYWKLSDYFDFRGDEIYIVPPGVESSN
ncbi:hypothetical protein SYNTR_0272 [Candidatus Syntrophocurvum alkaliphilum]|uniref:DUF1285 domain-containing protein n=1 Tax=Candidatus Syntrophocurvum alkaliphilum TaxID=2293317 RepID=A0A6I6DBY8_9FIRM|nr:DUF1285 domain-containing protein [Candidatus Syntrophocurvum alkaliphilum]QGT98865.1 hypothetical protein SYNTR_0272 [Candidatus Syntrophocurvum alkaliphilum]